MNWIKQAISWLFNSNRQKIRYAVQIVQNIKNALDSKEVQFLVDLIPGNLDNIVREELIQLTRSALYVLELGRGMNLLPEALKSLRRMDKFERNKKYEEIAGYLASKLTGMSGNDAKRETTLFYEANKHLI